LGDLKRDLINDRSGTIAFDEVTGLNGNGHATKLRASHGLFHHFNGTPETTHIHYFCAQ